MGDLMWIGIFVGILLLLLTAWYVSCYLGFKPGLSATCVIATLVVVSALSALLGRHIMGAEVGEHFSYRQIHRWVEQNPALASRVESYLEDGKISVGEASRIQRKREELLEEGSAAREALKAALKDTPTDSNKESDS